MNHFLLYLFHNFWFALNYLTTLQWLGEPLLSISYITLVSDEFPFSAHKLFCMKGKELTLMYTLLQSPHLKFFASSPFSILYDVSPGWVSIFYTLTVWHENQRTYTDILFITNFALKRIWSWPKTFKLSSEILFHDEQCLFWFCS